jgi:hypothetical protein
VVAILDEGELPVAFNALSVFRHETQRIDVAMQQSELDMCKNDLVMTRLTEDAVKKAAALDDALADLKMQERQLQKEREQHKAYSQHLIAQARAMRNSMEQQASALKLEKDRLKSHMASEASAEHGRVEYAVNVNASTLSPPSPLPSTSSRSKKVLKGMSRLVNG